MKRQTQVSAFKKELYGRVASLSVWLKGEPLPEIQHQSIFHDNDEIRLRWNAPQVPIANITYGVYYGVTLDELFESNILNIHNSTIIYAKCLVFFLQCPALLHRRRVPF